MALTNLQRLQHLAWRSGFGLTPAEWDHWQHHQVGKYLRKVVFRLPSEVTPVQVPEVEELAALNPQERLHLIKTDRKSFNRMNAIGTRNLNVAWLDQMATTSHPLQEKMALFWHGHFACRGFNATYTQQLLSIIRNHALGNFSDLLVEVSKSPAMLLFLNNQQNRKQHPNENFAREVMELFTMGRGHYTEQDVKEGARAFTGWGFNPKGEFVFRRNLHDSGMKEFLGKKGQFTGDDVLQIILENRNTARFITAKVVSYFVGDTMDPEIQDTLSDRFYQSDYNIKTLMRDIFEADWFYSTKVFGNRIKSPVELLVGLRRTVPVTFQHPEVQVLFQRILGQTLFYPPNVGGWPGGRSWIDSSSLLFRMRLPELIYYSSILDIHPKDMPDEMPDSYEERELKDPFMRNYALRLHAQSDWTGFASGLDGLSASQLALTLTGRLLTGDRSGYPIQWLQQASDHQDKNKYVQTMAIHLMSSPEYQLC